MLVGAGGLLAAACGSVVDIPGNGDAATPAPSGSDGARPPPNPPPGDAARPGIPEIVMSRHAAQAPGVGVSSQPELEAMIARGDIPARYVDPRPAGVRYAAWLREAEALGVVRFSESR